MIYLIFQPYLPNYLCGAIFSSYHRKNNIILFSLPNAKRQNNSEIYDI